ncbi:hypothetical protein METP3_02847 [Methanosarcinales archaeon]|nr:hypothetical protein METP3_02847 [Methanosarcinales archaeon]
MEKMENVQDNNYEVIGLVLSTCLLNKYLVHSLLNKLIS